MIKTKTPTGLGVTGDRFWREIIAAYELRADELAILDHACRTMDTIDRIDAELRNQPVTVPGSTGQIVAHPLLGEARMHRLALARLITTLHLPEDASGGAEIVAAGQRRTHAARAAATARWQG
jgi:hypothetical protein